jgi:hypothetical protein
VFHVLTTIRDAWGWTGLDPEEVVAVNAFGNVLVRAVDGTFWRICPEELSCEVIACDPETYVALQEDARFQADWQMERLVHLASSKLGPLPDGRCYCLKLPGVLGGAYEEHNLGTITLDELIAFSGDLAEQIKDLPDGAQIEIKWKD